MSESAVNGGDFVKCLRGPYKGVVGKVKSVHRGGPVPDVPADVMGTALDPAARLQCYKAMGAGHEETVHHVGVKLSHLEKCAALKPPKVRKAATRAPLPPLTGKTDGQVTAEKLGRAAKALKPGAKGKGGP